MRTINQLCDVVRESAYAIHRYHGHGHLEKVYENALAHRLKKGGLKVQQQFPIEVFDEDGTTIGEYFADLIVEDSLIVELKATRVLTDEHVAQVLGYLRSARREHGLLMNFGSYKFQIRKYAISRWLSEPKKSSHASPFLFFCDPCALLRLLFPLVPPRRLRSRSQKGACETVSSALVFLHSLRSFAAICFCYADLLYHAQH